MSIVKSIPVSEDGQSVRCKTKSGKAYLITQNRSKMRFTLWRILDDGFEKLTTGNSPYDLYENVPWSK